LAHNQGDLTGGGVYEYSDPETGRIGEYELTVTGDAFCGQVSAIEVTSVGRTDANPDAVAIISATYRQPTVAEYSFINNEGVRFGADRIITGPVHGNSWVHIDGAHNSFVGSQNATYSGSDSEYFGNGAVFSSNPPELVNANPSLFVYPIDQIAFSGLATDLDGLRNGAIAEGIHYGPSNWSGYKVVFNGNSTVDIYQVQTNITYWAFSERENWHANEFNVITSQNRIANNRAINPDCPVLFFEDKVWIEGVVNQKVAIAAGLNAVNAQNNIVVDGNITYVAGTEAGLVAIAEDDIDIGLDVPNNMTVNGIYIAQDGRFGRNNYCTSCSEWTPSGSSWVFRNVGLPNALDQYVIRNSLTRLGSVVSNQRGGTAWSAPGMPTSSGFLTRDTSFDRNQVDNPPPLTPITNQIYELQDWRSEG